MNNYEPYVSPASELYHWGIPGMKWGQPRYQNPDGTWTSLGLRRRRERENRDREEAAASVKKDYNRAVTMSKDAYDDKMNNLQRYNKLAAAEKIQRDLISNKARAAAEKRANEQKYLEDSSRTALNVGKEGLNIVDTVYNSRLDRKKAEAMSKMDLSEMSNKDLQDYITRKNLEKQYKNLAVEDMNLGNSFVDKVLDRGGNALVVAGSAISVMLGIRKLIYG